MDSTLIDFAVSAGIAAQYRRPWAQHEHDFLRDNLGRLTYAEIGEHLGRSEEAVKIRQVRRRLPAPSRRPGWLTGNQVAKILAVDIHAVMRLVDSGLLPAERLPGERGIIQVRRVTLRRWAINPENWVYFKAERVKDRGLRRLIEIKRARWGDEWWTTGRTMRYFGVATPNTIHQAIRRGHLPAKRWGNWFVKRSDALAYGFSPGKGSRARREWSARADAFLCKARDEWGLSWGEIGRMMKWDFRRVAYRYGNLKGCA